MKKEKYVSFEQAKELVKSEFDWPTIMFWSKNGDYLAIGYKSQIYLCPAPKLKKAYKWLSEKGIKSELFPQKEEDGFFIQQYGRWLIQPDLTGLNTDFLSEKTILELLAFLVPQEKYNESVGWRYIENDVELDKTWIRWKGPKRYIPADIRVIEVVLSNGDVYTLERKSILESFEPLDKINLSIAWRGK